MQAKKILCLIICFYSLSSTLYAQNSTKCGLYKKTGWGRTISSSSICVSGQWDDEGEYLVDAASNAFTIRRDYDKILRDGIIEWVGNCSGSCEIHVIDSTHFEITSLYTFICNGDGVLSYIQHYLYFEYMNTESCDPIESGPDMPTVIDIINEIPGKNKRERTLWSGSTDDTPDIIKICADGSNATKIRITNFNTNIKTSDIKFDIQNQLDNNNWDANAKIYSVVVSDNTITATLMHPDYIPSKVEKFCYEFKIVITCGNKRIAIPVQVYRAPVLMFHGLWGDRSAFQKMKERLTSDGYCPGELVLTADYSNKNDVSFAENSNVVPYYLDIMLNICRLKGYSAGKVDVIGHSMGGLLIRNYLQSETYPGRDDIHEITTINTPHSGSQFANFLLQANSQAAFIVGIGLEAFEKKGYPNASINGGAVKDLAVNSEALRITNVEELNNWTVPSHAISTQTLTKTDNWLYDILLVAGLNPEEYLDNIVFCGQSNDMIVSVLSQTGGLATPENTLISGQIHIGSPNNELIINEVEKAIMTNPSDPFYFSSTGFAPVAQTSPFKKALISSPIDLIPGSIAITWPLRNQEYNPGSSVPVSFSSTNDINRIKFEAITAPDNITVVDTAFAFGNITYKIPQNSYGGVKFIAFGFNSDTLIGFDTLTIKVNVTSTLDSITFPDEAIYVRENSVTPLSVTGWFKNGYHQDISRNSEVEYILADTISATLKQINLIKGKTQGVNMVTVKYLNKTLNIPVFVFAIDTVSSEITYSNNIKNLPSEEISEITIYSDPATDYVYIVHTGQATIEIYNMQGILLKSKLSNENESIIDISSLPGGVYIVKVKTPKGALGTKFVKQ